MFTATAFSSQDIVRDGLVLWLDANDKTSYPGSGTVWRDLSLGENDGILTNGPTFNSGNGGNIMFDGVDDKLIGTSSPSLSFGNGSTDTPFSLYAWIYLNDINTPSPIIAKYRSYNPFRGEYSMVISNGKLVMQCVDGSPVIRVRQDSNNTLSTNRWYNVVGTYNGNSTDEGIVLYVNGEISPSSGLGQDGSYVAMKVAADPSELTIGVMLDEGNLGFREFFNGKIAIVQVYNRALSPKEITQNYNAQKGRFGL